jgi:hypothetical protein
LGAELLNSAILHRTSEGLIALGLQKMLDGGIISPQTQRLYH